MTGHPLVWIGFSLLVLAVLALDLGVFHRKAHAVGFKEALSWTGVWVTLAVLFGAGVWHWAGPQKGLEFFTGYLIEYSLSADNVFVFVLIFSYFARTGAVAAQGVVLGRAGGAGDAPDHDWAGGGSHQPVRVDSLCLRRVSPVHGV